MNKKLMAENAGLRAENAALKSDFAELKSRFDWLVEQLADNKRKMFGSSSEKTAYCDGYVQFGLFGDDDTQEIVIFDNTDKTAPEPNRKANKKKSEIMRKLPDGLPVETVKCELPPGECGCPVCQEFMRVIGKEIARRELKIIPAKVVVVEYERSSYSCPNGCLKPSSVSDDMVSVIVKAELPPQVIKGSPCSPETVAHIAVEKCIMGSPLYRQEAQWNRLGIPFNRQTMASWLIRCSEDYFEPIYDELHLRMLRYKFLHSDGTTFQVLNEPGKTPQSQSCMWIYRTSGEAEHPIVLYEYQPDKKQERANAFLEGFAGYLMTDGSSSYRDLPDDIILVGCFSHCRRYFVDALMAIKNAKEREGSLPSIGKDYCDRVFDVERKIKDKTFEERYELRNKETAQILDEFHAWLLSAQPAAAPKSMTGKAINYALNQWKYLYRILLDGRIEVSNNRCERSVKPFVINRKNFLFADSVAGARATAVIHSLTETAKESKLNPFEYLAHVLRTAAGNDLRENPKLATELLPKNAPDSCKVLK